jgi:hypothetical protein
MGGGDGGGFFDDVGGFIEDATGINMGGNSSADRALRAQQQAADQAAATQRYIFDTTRADQEPWRQSGMRALSGMENGDFQRDFTAADFQKDPGYDFRMSEGMKAIERSAAARGGLNSGATMKALARYNQDFASNEFQNAYNRFNADRDRRFNRLGSLAGVGQTATNQVGQAGQNYANSMSDIYTGMGNARGAAGIAQANRAAGFVNGMMETRGKLAGAGIMASDERLKTEVEPVSKAELDEMKSYLRAFKFKYKNEKYGRGEFIGVMTQDLEKSKLGRTLVVDMGDGYKGLDINRVMSLFLATLAEG